MKRIKATTRTTDGPILTGSGLYYGSRVTSDGTALARAIVYDSLSAVGTIIDELAVGVTGAAGAGAPLSVGEQFHHPIEVAIGIFVDVTTPARVVVWNQDTS